MTSGPIPSQAVTGALEDDCGGGVNSYEKSFIRGYRCLKGIQIISLLIF